MSDKSGVIADYRAVLDEFYDTAKIDLKIAKLLEPKGNIEKDAKKLVLKTHKLY
jgi:hypothetical protein